MKNVLKKLVKPATTILSKCKNYGNKLLKSDNFIGVPTFAIQQGLIQSLDKAYDKLIDKGYEVQTLALNRIIPFNFKTRTSKVETVEIRETLTKLSTKEGVVFMDTSYYMFFSSKIKNVEFYIYDSNTSTNPVCLILNDEIVGIVMPFKCTDDAWNSDRTLEEYKSYLEIEELKEIKNNEFLQSLVNEYIDYHNKSLKEVPQHFENIVSYELEKVNKQVYQVVGITKDNQRQYYFKMTMLNCDVNLTEQKKIFKMIKEYLLTSTLELQQKDDKINDLTVEEDNKNNKEVKEMENTIIKLFNEELNKDKKIGIESDTINLCSCVWHRLNPDQRHKIMKAVDYKKYKTEKTIYNKCLNYIENIIKEAENNKSKVKYSNNGYNTFKKYEVKANDITDFCNKYYKYDRYTGRGKEYIECCIKHHTEQLDKYGYTILSSHDNVTGDTVAYYGNKEDNIKNDNINFIDLNSTHKQLITIEGNTATIKNLTGSTIWKTSTRDIIKDYGHKDVNTYIKHLKKFGYKEIKDISMYKEDDKITISSPEVEDLSMNLQLLANKDLVNTINESFINNSNNVRNNIIEINSINDIKNIDIKDQFQYMVFWTYTDTKEKCKQGYKGKYINKILNEFLECEFIDNIKICSHDYFLNNFNKIKDNTDLLN